MTSSEDFQQHFSIISKFDRFLCKKEYSFYTQLFCCTELRWMFISSTSIWVTDSDIGSVASKARSQLTRSKCKELYFIFKFIEVLIPFYLQIIGRRHTPLTSKCYAMLLHCWGYLSDPLYLLPGKLKFWSFLGTENQDSCSCQIWLKIIRSVLDF